MVDQAAIPTLDQMRGNRLFMNGTTWQRECLFHVSRDCQAVVLFTRQPTRREIENLLRFMQLSIDLGAYGDDQPQSVGA